MKKQIRSNVFETNSSSMHSLVIKKSSGYYTYEEMCDSLWLHKGVWDIWSEDDLEFGRYPFKCLNTFETKARYAIASLCGWRSDADEKFKEIESLVTEIVPDCISIKLPKVHYWSDDEEKICYGSVDEDILSQFLKKENISLKEFLTNKRYVVIVDGDEYCVWDDLKNSGLVNTNEIEREFPHEETN